MSSFLLNFANDRRHYWHLLVMAQVCLLLGSLQDNPCLNKKKLTHGLHDSEYSAKRLWCWNKNLHFLSLKPNSIKYFLHGFNVYTEVYCVNQGKIMLWNWNFTKNFSWFYKVKGYWWFLNCHYYVSIWLFYL